MGQGIHSICDIRMFYKEKESKNWLNWVFKNKKQTNYYFKMHFEAVRLKAKDCPGESKAGPCQGGSGNLQRMQ